LIRSWSSSAEGEGKIAMIARLGIVLYWCGLAIAFLCEIAAMIVLVVIANDPSASDAWMALVFFGVVGVFSWLAGRAAKQFLAEVDAA
jgi:hypothetical protein